MAQTETLGLLEEIQFLVCDQLQVVSYKWLSRNFLVSSNAAKRLLKEFAEKHGKELEVVYSLSGWLKKNSPPTYHIRLVSGSKLSEAEQDFDGKCSVHVYSVQASIPNDPVALWNAEYLQTEELFRQPPAVDNCLRDNRFCGIYNSNVNRNVEGNQVSVSATQTSGLSRSISSHQEKTTPSDKLKKSQQSSPAIGIQTLNGLKEVKNENKPLAINPQSSVSSTGKERIPPQPANTEKVQDEKSLSGAGGSLANLWGRASGKSKHSAAPADCKTDLPDPRESLVSSNEACNAENDGDELQDLNIKRASTGDGRKRKVVMDLSDEESDDGLSLASPGIPKGKSGKQSSKSKVSDGFDSLSLNTKNNEPKIKIEKDKEESKSVSGDSLFVSNEGNGNGPSSKKIGICVPEAGAIVKDKATEAPTSPKRRKVLKTRIDERGREVTDVVWEGGETEPKKVESDSKKTENSGTTKKREENTSIGAINKPLGTKKSPANTNAAAANTGGRTGNKKGANAKDPKQGNILSFFKKV